MNGLFSNENQIQTNKPSIKKNNFNNINIKDNNIEEISPRSARFYNGLNKFEVTPELYFNFEKEDTNIPYSYQGDVSFYTTQTVGMRSVLKNSNKIKLIIRRFWETQSKDKDGYLSKNEYIELLIKIQRALYENFDLNKAKIIAEKEWDKDCSDHKSYNIKIFRMSYYEYFNALFELADTWTDEISPQVVLYIFIIVC